MAVLAAALAAVAVWGATPIATKLAVAGLEPLAVGLLRTLLAGLLALPVVLLGRLAPPSSARGRGRLAVSAAGGFVLFPILFSLGLGLTSAAHGALILAVLPVFTGLIAAALERRLPAARWWLGAAIALFGTALLIGARFGLAAPGEIWAGSLPGDLLVLASALAASAGYVTGARAVREAGTWAVTFWGLLLGGIALLPILPFALAPASLVQAGADVWAALLYLAGLSSILAYAAWYWALGRGDIARTGLIQFAQPVIGLVLAVILLGEALAWPLVLSAAVIIGGVALAQSARPVTPRHTQ
ncbi:MAG: DMT family transporter [Rhodospirillales bacterium]|nr:DMT family transporter [Rhodospirillales bacterium]